MDYLEKIIKQRGKLPMYLSAIMIVMLVWQTIKGFQKSVESGIYFLSFLIIWLVISIIVMVGSSDVANDKLIMIRQLRSMTDESEQAAINKYVEDLRHRIWKGGLPEIQSVVSHVTIRTKWDKINFINSNDSRVLPYIPKPT